MAPPERTPTLAEVVQQALDSRLPGLHVAMPARVEKFDAATGTVDATPLVQQSYLDEEGTLTFKPFPVVPNVPIVFQGAGVMRITLPVAVGDTVLLVFADGNFDPWRSNGNSGPSGDTRAHDLSDAIAIPGLKPRSGPWKNVDASVITIGSEDGEPEWVATAKRVKDQLSAITDKFNSHTHTVSTAGAPTAHTGTAAPPSSPMSPPSEPASATLKIRG